MAIIQRLCGSIIATSNGEYFMIGDTKEPCDFENYGFVPPAERDAKEIPYIKLQTQGPVSLGGSGLYWDIEGEALCEKLAETFLIKRNGSVSERLWGLVLETTEESHSEEALDGSWLANTPDEVWEIVRDSVLRC